MRRTSPKSELQVGALALNTKARLTIAAAWVVATVGIVIIESTIVLPSFVDLEMREAVKDAGRVSGAFSAELADLAKLTRDWGAWEETWRYVQGDNPGFLDENLSDETFISLDIQAMVLLDVEGHLVWARVIDPSTRDEIHLVEFSPEAFDSGNSLAWGAQTQGPYAAAVRRGFMRTAAGIMAYASCPVLRNYEEGPVRGSLIQGRLLSESLFEKLRERTRVSFGVEALPGGTDATGPEVAISHDAPAIASDGRLMRASFTLDGAAGEALARVTVERPIDIISRGRTTMYWSLGSLLVTLAGVLVALTLLLHRTVLDPIGQLTRMVIAIRTTGNFVARLGLRRSDEVGTLATNFDAMLDLLSEKTQALSDMAATDVLTEMPNRRTILDALVRESARASRYTEPLALLMIDVDHFKQVNDTHGHAVGDLVLKGVAATLRATVRNSDFAGRLGGEEFLVILPHQDERGALIAAERIRHRIAEAEMGPDRLKVTVSIGVCTIGADGAEGMLARADSAMYAAKEAGRNRVSCGSASA